MDVISAKTVLIRYSDSYDYFIIDRMLNSEASLQSLLNPELSQTLVTLANQTGQSLLVLIENLLREALAVHQPSPTTSADSRLLTQKLNQLEQIKQHRAAILARRNNQPLQAILNQLREERDAEILANCNLPRD
ncbi:MAG: hypothetical protein BWK78_05655 [Thiotrichaceae bacterium IS1]|nr:MAG: hypothetical protein BWK78_05655 [Thiotrichaceae bacterium IS1]